MLEPDALAFSESSPYIPNSPYAASKAASDHMVRAYGHTYGLPTSITHCTNNYGPYQFPEKLIPLVILNAVAGRELPVYGDGQHVRDWLFIEEHCEALWRVLRDGQRGEVYAIGSETQHTNLQIVRQVCAILDEVRCDSPHVPHESLIRFVADRPGHDRRYALDCTRIKEALGWKPKEPLESGLHQTVEWYLNHPAWVAAVQHLEYRRWMDRNYTARGAVPL
jgi:dTDP-glucose 4,6-dehydratase